MLKNNLHHKRRLGHTQRIREVIERRGTIGIAQLIAEVSRFIPVEQALKYALSGRSEKWAAKVSPSYLVYMGRAELVRVLVKRAVGSGMFVWDSEGIKIGRDRLNRGGQLSDRGQKVLKYLKTCSATSKYLAEEFPGSWGGLAHTLKRKMESGVLGRKIINRKYFYFDMATAKKYDRMNGSHETNHLPL